MRGNDVTLIQRTLEGDQNAFTALVNKVSEMGPHACMAEDW